MKSTLLLLLFAVVANAQDYHPVRALQQQAITIPINKPISFKIQTSLKPGWVETDRITPFRSILQIPEAVAYLFTNDGTYYVWAPVGTYEIESSRVLINWTKQDIDDQTVSIILTVTGTSPTPNPETTNPFSNALGLRVVIIEEQENRSKLPKSQLAIITSLEIRDYLDNKCAKDPDNNPEWRFLDQNTPTTAPTKWAKSLAEHSGKPVPWIIISNGTKWTSVALPNTIAATLALIKLYE